MRGHHSQDKMTALKKIEAKVKDVYQQFLPRFNGRFAFASPRRVRFPAGGCMNKY